jgi:phosphoglycerate dehydrogenase-like enzyme
LPNVLVTPHNSSSSIGNERRVFDAFVHNLEHWKNNQLLIHEIFRGEIKNA